MLKESWLKFLASELSNQAKVVLKKYDPLVIGVTGSVGKSSTKEAIYAVLNQKFHTWRNVGNLNNELGVPLTILGHEKPVGVGGWLKFVLKNKLSNINIPNYPACLVLEIAADKKGDLKYLCDMIKPTIGVVTNVGESHMEFFGNKKSIMIEKRTLIESLPKNGKAILNFDDELVMQMQKKSSAEVTSYGLKKGADIGASNIKIELAGTNFKLIYNGSVVPIKIKPIGYSFVMSALAAVSVGLSMGMNILEIVKGLSTWESLPGRMKLIAGENNIRIIDDTYNASPDSVINAIESMKLMQIKNRKVAILGSMWELGKATKAGHDKVGKRAGRYFDKLLCVESYAELIRKGALKAGMKDSNIMVFSNTNELLNNLDNILHENDVLLVKGSQSKNRLERVVKKLMIEKSKAPDLLVRQSDDWRDK
jgi:UDP-N-acetylmuramoyl-tripeptide--D-alanyl-D-alanine ligase